MGITKMIGSNRGYTTTMQSVILQSMQLFTKLFSNKLKYKKMLHEVAEYLVIVNKTILKRGLFRKNVLG